MICALTRVTQKIGQGLRIFLRHAIDNARPSSTARRRVLQQLQHILLCIFFILLFAPDLKKQVGPQRRLFEKQAFLEAALVEVEDAIDVLEHLVCRRSRQSHDGDMGIGLSKFSQLQDERKGGREGKREGGRECEGRKPAPILPSKETYPVEIRAKVVSPLTDAMRLVDDKASQHPLVVQLGQQLLISGREEEREGGKEENIERVVDDTMPRNAPPSSLPPSFPPSLPSYLEGLRLQ